MILFLCVCVLLVLTLTPSLHDAQPFFHTTNSLTPHTMVNDAKKISEVLTAPRDSKYDNKDGVTWSFEFFPPKTDAGVTNLNARLGRMRGMNPEFVDYTWGAGGSTSTLTMDLCKAAQQTHGYISNMHLTCTNMEAGKVEEALAEAKSLGIRNIVALRGDPPVGQTEWKATDTGFKCALDLVRFIREKYGDYFCVSVAGYPEGHPDQITNYEEYLKVGKVSEEIYKAEMDYLKAKVDAGADLIISQMFYDADIFLNWVKVRVRWVFYRHTSTFTKTRTPTHRTVGPPVSRCRSSRDFCPSRYEEAQ